MPVCLQDLKVVTHLCFGIAKRDRPRVEYWLPPPDYYGVVAVPKKWSRRRRRRWIWTGNKQKLRATPLCPCGKFDYWTFIGPITFAVWLAKNVNAIDYGTSQTCTTIGHIMFMYSMFISINHCVRSICQAQVREWDGVFEPLKRDGFHVAIAITFYYAMRMRTSFVRGCCAKVFVNGSTG